MTLPDDILVKDGTPTVWANSGDYSSTVSGLVRTLQIDLTSVADTEAREGAKADLGEKRAAGFTVYAGIEMAVAPASKTLVEFYWAESPSATPGNANPGGTSGVDGDYTGTAGDSLADSVAPLYYIGALVMTADATAVVQYGRVGALGLVSRYGSIVVKNETGQAFMTDAVEMFVALVPIPGVIID